MLSSVSDTKLQQNTLEFDRSKVFGKGWPMAINEVGKMYHRPWGTYQTLALTANYQVKIITVKPGGKLSLQRHFHRCEHWVVVKGSPTLTVANHKQTYSVNQHVYIPKEALHRIENDTSSDCQLLELQLGDYLGEDDIERVQDQYGRIAVPS